MQVRLAQTHLQGSRRHILLLGPRQVGKSTLLKALQPDRYLNLADEALFLAHAKDPARLRREVEALSRPSLVVVDGVQRVPRLLNTCWDPRGHPPGGASAGISAPTPDYAPRRATRPGAAV